MDARTGATDGGARGPGVTRRAVLAGGAATLGAGAAGTAAAQQGGGPSQVPDFGGWFGADSKGGETGTYTGVADMRGQDSATVRVGASGNGGTFAFSPTAVWVDPGTTITFEWVSNTHNVSVESQPDGAGWAGHETVESSGFTFEHTFETNGVYTYFCSPHLAQGMKGGIAVGDDVPLTSPPSTGGGFKLPGGDAGVAFMGLLFGTVGLASALVLAGELHGSVTRDADGPTSAHTTALVAATVGLVLLVAVVGRLLLG